VSGVVQYGHEKRLGEGGKRCDYGLHKVGKGSLGIHSGFTGTGDYGSRPEDNR